MKKQAGFTLTEMLIVVVIMAILATIAVPSYREAVRRSDRRAAQSAMMEIANRAATAGWRTGMLRAHSHHTLTIDRRDTRRASGASGAPAGLRECQLAVVGQDVVAQVARLDHRDADALIDVGTNQSV